MKILIVDDSKVMRAIVKRTLRQAGFGGHELQEAGNGKEGLDAVGTIADGVGGNGFQQRITKCWWRSTRRGVA